MEHAGGGELFDYIVTQNKLREKEARYGVVTLLDEKLNEFLTFL